VRQLAAALQARIKGGSKLPHSKGFASSKTVLLFAAGSPFLTELIRVYPISFF
jgi:hypothetical protein